MSFFGSMLQAAVDTVVLPIAAAVDIVELGKNHRTSRQVDRVIENIEDAVGL